jgi:hypothetical protein
LKRFALAVAIVAGIAAPLAAQAPGAGDGSGSSSGSGSGSGSGSAESDKIDRMDADFNAQSTGVAPPGETTPSVEADTNTDPPTTGAVQGGIYTDSDKTTVWRTLGQIASSWGNWALNGRVGIDVVSSASATCARRRSSARWTS